MSDEKYSGFDMITASREITKAANHWYAYWGLGRPPTHVMLPELIRCPCGKTTIREINGLKVIIGIPPYQLIRIEEGDDVHDGD